MVLENFMARDKTRHAISSVYARIHAFRASQIFVRHVKLAQSLRARQSSARQRVRSVSHIGNGGR